MIDGSTRKYRWDWWIYAAILLAVLQAAAFLIPQARPGGLTGILWWSFGQQVFPLGAGLLLVLGLVWSAIRRPFRRRHRTVAFVGLALLYLSQYAFQVYPSSHDRSPSQVRFRLPLDGPVTVAWGGGAPGLNYHVAYPDQRWAYDLFVTRDGKSFRGDGTKREDYYYYGAAVRAPADGMVVSTLDGRPELPPGKLGGEPAGGNQVVIQVAPKQFLFLCHLRPGSLRVKKGDRVRVGQVIARGGNSGNTSEPHLHLHLQDTSEDGLGEGIPLYFHGYRLEGRIVERGIPTGGGKPQIVEHAALSDQADPSPISRSRRLQAVQPR